MEVILNSALLAEGEGVTATCLGQRRSSGGKYIPRSLKVIHRVPSVEGATATCLDSFKLFTKYIKINRKNAPNGISPCNNNKTRRTPMERISYTTYSVGKGKEYSFEFKQDAVFAAQELGIKPTARKFKISRNTLRTWNRRFKKQGKKGLYDRRQGPHLIPNKMPLEMEEKIVSIRQNNQMLWPSEN
jgi:transposase-like protein